jgi:2-methylcitrate dehydratase PrpD
MAVGLTRALAEWVARLRVEDLPTAVVERAQLQTASVLGAVFAGARSDLLARIRRAVGRWGGRLDASVIPTGPRLPVHAACYVNAAASVAFDFDDYLFAGHTGHSSVLGTLAWAEALGAPGRDVLVAQVAANELGGRLGAAMLFGPHNGQMWTYIHALAGATVGARFLGLDAERTTHAFGLALAQPPWPLAPAFFGPDSKALMVSGPLVDGLRAAELAAEGLTGAADILGDPQGFLAKLTPAPLAFAFSGLGRAWLTESLSFKLYPGCAYVDTPVDASEQIREQFARKAGRRLAPEDVERIRVRATLFTAGMEILAAPYRSRERLRAVDVNFSVALSLGVLIACGAITVETLSEHSLAEHHATILAVADRVTVEQDAELTKQVGGLGDLGIEVGRYLAAHKGRLGARGDLLAEQLVVAEPSSGDDYQPSLDAADFSRFQMRFPARVTLTTTAGEEFVAEQAIPLGGAGRPLAEVRAAVRDKFIRNARPHLGSDAEVTFDIVMNLDKARDVRAVIDALLVPEACCSR